jgi:hypothetical protein
MMGLLKSIRRKRRTAPLMKNQTEASVIDAMEDDRVYHMEHNNGVPVLGGLRLKGSQWKQMQRDFKERGEYLKSRSDA